MTARMTTMAKEPVLWLTSALVGPSPPEGIGLQWLTMRRTPVVQNKKIPLQHHNRQRALCQQPRERVNALRAAIANCQREVDAADYEVEPTHSL